MEKIKNLISEHVCLLFLLFFLFELKTSFLKYKKIMMLETSIYGNFFNLVARNLFFKIFSKLGLKSALDSCIVYYQILSNLWNLPTSESSKIWFWIKTQHFIIHPTTIFFYNNFLFFSPLESLIVLAQQLS